MKRAVVWSRAALVDLKTQLNFIARENPGAARKVVERIRTTGDGLSEFATGHPGRVPQTYEKSVAGLPYIIAYAIDHGDQAERVVVLHVIHTARNWPEENWPT